MKWDVTPQHCAAWVITLYGLFYDSSSLIPRSYIHWVNTASVLLQNSSFPQETEANTMSWLELFKNDKLARLWLFYVLLQSWEKTRNALRPWRDPKTNLQWNPPLGDPCRTPNRCLPGPSWHFSLLFADCPGYWQGAGTFCPPEWKRTNTSSYQQYNQEVERPDLNVSPMINKWV